MNIVLAGISAKFIHTPLAVHLLSRYAEEQYGIRSRAAEFTINQSEDAILAALYRLSPDLLGFSCYIWNYALVRRLVPSLKKVLPGLKVFLGGPEVSFDPAAALAETGADFVLSGEGEEPFSRLCLALRDGLPLESVPSLCWREGGALRQTPPAPPLDLAKLPFASGDLSGFDNRILYYEAQRGCPFNCQYCLSSAEKGVRFQPAGKAEAELKRFLDAKVRQVKFVDRTFNADPRFAMRIWRYLAAHDNGATNFHFEIEGGLLTAEQLDFLRTVRPGLFQFEIGVQSANPETLRAVRRRNDFEKLAHVVRRLREGRNIHLHLDLIAGLPHEDYESFGRSFDLVYGLRPDQLQLGFLKLLKGSGLRRDAAEYGIVWRDEPPYEVLETAALPFGDLLRLKEIEELLDLYCNSGRFSASLGYLMPLAGRPFAFFEGFARWRREKGLAGAPHTLLDQYEHLREYGLRLPGCGAEALGWRMRFDLYSHEKCRRLPDWLPVLDSPALQKARRALLADPAFRREYLLEYEGLTPSQLERTAHLDFFPFDLLDEGDKAGRDAPCALLFHYRRTDLLGRAAVIRLPGQKIRAILQQIDPFGDTIKMNW